MVNKFGSFDDVPHTKKKLDSPIIEPTIGIINYLSRLSLRLGF
jgi:hypothetical protein